MEEKILIWFGVFSVVYVLIQGVAKKLAVPTKPKRPKLDVQTLSPKDIENQVIDILSSTLNQNLRNQSLDTELETLMYLPILFEAIEDIEDHFAIALPRSIHKEVCTINDLIEAVGQQLTSQTPNERLDANA